jgi:hypothetical protein
MKKVIMVISLISITVVSKAQDTLILKSGVKLGGKITLMDDGVIKIKTGKETASYTAAEIQTIMFCNTEKSTASSPCPCDGKDETAKGTVVFECNSCGNKGSLKIYGSAESPKSTSTVKFSSDEKEYRFGHKESLLPGAYKWEYSDNRNNATKGVLKIIPGETKRIVLFEKE